MWLPARGRVCTLAAAGSLLTCACSGRYSTLEPAPAANGGTSSGGTSASGASSGGTSSGGTAGIASGGAGQAGSFGGVGGAIVLDAGPGTAGAAGSSCALDCSGSSFCNSCTALSGPPASCYLDGVPGNIASGNLWLDCNPLTYGTDFIETESLQILLVGDACDALETNAPHRIEYLLGCPLDR